MTEGRENGYIEPSKKLLLTFSNPVDPSLEAEYNAWYTETHIPQLLRHVSGIKEARRYRVDGDAPSHRYFVAYVVEGSTSEIMEELAQRRAEGKIERSATLETDPAPLMLFVEPIEERAFVVD